MIDPTDRQTQTLPLDEQPAKPRRGRPVTGKALSNAERQRRYRENLKAQRNENMHKEVAEDMRAELAKAMERIEELESELKRWKKLATAAERARQAVAKELTSRDDNNLMQRVELAEARADAMGNELAKAKAKAAKAGPTKRRYVLQFRYEDANGMHWHDDQTGDYGSKKQAENACKRMNEPGVSQTEWRVRERQWV